MAAPARTLEIRTSPHVSSGYSVDTIMFNVVLALLPTTLFAVYAFGLAALLVVTTALAACLLTEEVLARLSGGPSTVGDGSVAITGLLYALTLPPGLPLWMVATGGAIGVGLGKALFGGLGANPFNPALVGRAFLQAAFPVAMTSWTPAFAPGRFASLPASTLTAPLSAPAVDGTTGATPLARFQFDGELTDMSDLALGFIGGSTGETSAVLILLGGLYLIARNMMNWKIPVGMLVAVFTASTVLHGLQPQSCPTPLFMILSGGLMLGAFFMATDMVASPVTSAGCFVYGSLIGLFVVAIRVWGGAPEGVMYAILLGNALSPHLDRWIRPRVYGRGAASRA